MLTDDEKCALLRKLVEDKEYRMRIALAFGKIPDICACEIIKPLSKDPTISIRDTIVRTQDNLPEECACDILERLSEDENAGIRGKLTYYQKNIPEACACNIFYKLGKDPETFIRDEIAVNDCIPEACACDILDALAEDLVSYVRTDALNNPLFKKCDEYEEMLPFRGNNDAQ